MTEEDRKPVVTVAELDSLDPAEILEGYWDGKDGLSEPGNNRSKAYWHGWRNGRSDRTHIVDPEGLALARAVVGRPKP